MVRVWVQGSCDSGGSLRQPKPRTPVIIDPTRVCELLVGLGDVTVLGATDVAGQGLYRLRDTAG